MSPLKIVFLFLCISTTTYAQSDSLAPGEYLYQFDMKYTGSESRVDPYYRYMLETLVDMAKKNDSVHIHVRGHVCCGPSLRLSKRRARKTYRYLIRAGLDKSKVSYKGYSDTRPKQWPEKTTEDEIANRRVDFVIRPMP